MNYQTKQSQMHNPHLIRTMGFFDVICLGINGVVGAGIFLLPGQLFSLAGTGALWVFPLCGALCFAIALCFAEMGGMYTTTGGAYLYAKDAFGPFVGFLVGSVMWFSSIIGWASVASGFGLYLEYFLPSEGRWLCNAIVIMFLAGLSIINYFGVKPGARTINFFTLGKLLSLCIFISVGLFFINGQNVAPPHNSGQFSVAAILALYAYTGFEFVVVPAGEMQHPQKHIPRVLFLVLTIVTVLYVVIQIVAAGAFPSLATSDKPLADAARYFMGATGGVIIGAGALLSIGGVNAGIALTSPRSLYALSADGFFPEMFSKIHPRYHTPYVAIIVTTVLTLVLTLTGSFRYLISASVMVSILQYIPTCLAVIILRKYRPERERSYRIPGGYCVPVFALMVCGWLICHVELKVIAATALAMVILLPLYFKKWLWRAVLAFVHNDNERKK
ncbi:MAG: amino acid permease [Candidatus Jettenia caeni]|nr:MAG: amino acid permease [Candidatus Jettenia caeni]